VDSFPLLAAMPCSPNDRAIFHVVSTLIITRERQPESAGQKLTCTLQVVYSKTPRVSRAAVSRRLYALVRPRSGSQIMRFSQDSLRSRAIVWIRL
jgi:hypothetical protein